MTERPDRELVDMARRGEVSAIGELFSRYWRAVRAAAFAVTGEFASAEDAASEAFRQAIAGIGSLRDPARVGPWLRTIAIRRARLERRLRMAISADIELFADPAHAPSAELERAQLAALVRRAVLRLPHPLREAIALVHFEGYATEPAARFLGIPGGTLRRRLLEGREQLRSEVDRILKGRDTMTEERNRKLEELRRWMDSGEVHRALMGAMELRPPAGEIADRIRSGFSLPAGIAAEASARAQDPAHPVGAAAAAIAEALPDFQPWSAAVGIPRSYRRLTRALIRPETGGGVFEILREHPEAEAFRAALGGFRLSDAIDLVWTAPGDIELKAVEQFLERLAARVLPGADLRFSPYAEPRYRAALQLRAAGQAMPCARGGVLWSQAREHGGSAHVRVFLEPCAELRTGEPVVLDDLTALFPQ